MKFTIKDYDLVLKELVNYLKTQSLYLSKNTDDGRISSIINEYELTKVILNSYSNIKIFKEWNLVIDVQPSPRWWFDILIKNPTESFYCPINIKISSFKNSSADNLSSKEGLFFALTGLVKNKCPITWDKYFKLLSTSLKENERDYYFLVINKDDTNEIFFNSLKRLRVIVPNGNNLPFQCKWSDNKTIINRTFKESKDFILKNLAISVLRRAKILDDFNDAFHEYSISINKIKE
ncbi:hypothetical protein [Mycoplasma nasistruthionis]|uniref:hypothetical protein n=1 Tax=Mycoplasma nasistruthionis TaxID=353852 RepID=UPI001C9E49B4|nr:hypothetical protein [Mycoplasma nasistruthionis]